MTGLEATYVSSKSFRISGNLTDILILDRKIKADCGQDGYKFGKIESSSYADGETLVLLKESESDDLTENLDNVWYEISPHMDDGRPIVRSDTRPLNMMTYFTMQGDDSTSIGGGVSLLWDFSNNEDDYEGPEIPSGFKAKKLVITFNCPVHLKDGTLYFFDAPFGQYLHMDIVVPAGGYYPNPMGQIPAYMLGLSGKAMYSQATEDTPFQRYVHQHYMCGTCPMGDELNAEGCSVDALPIGWFVRGLIITPESDIISKGFACLEMYRCHTMLLPGQTIDDIH
jgi:hypothetical protein